MHRAPFTVTACTALFACAPAAEGRLEIRARVGGATALDEVEGVGQDGRPGLATSGMVMWGVLLGKAQRWGFCAGGGLFLDAHRGVRSDVKSTYFAHGLEATAGAIFQLDAAWHGELRALGRFGQGRLTADGSSSDRDDYSALGLTMGGFYTFPSHLQLGVEASWMEWEGDSVDDGDTVTAKGDGLSLFGTIGYRF